MEIKMKKRILEKIAFLKFIRKWHNINKHNTTAPINKFPISCVSVGKETYGGLYILSFDEQHKLMIGSYCSIAPNVVFLLSADHYSNHISSFPFKVKILGKDAEGVSKGDIKVDDDVWIGYGATIMSGVHIGQGAIIAAGAVITKDVPPYAIVAGVPAKVVKYRFSQELIEEIDYSKLEKEDIEKHIGELYIELKDINQLNWMPKKSIRNERC